MEANKDKKLDDFIKKIVVDAKVEEPSPNFTESVMQNIRTGEELQTGNTYSPLITKKSWIIYAIGLVGLFAFLLTFEGEKEFFNFTIPFLEYFPDLDYLVTLDNINIHKNVIYSVLMLSFFFYIQIIWLKKRVEL